MRCFVFLTCALGIACAQSRAIEEDRAVEKFAKVLIGSLSFHQFVDKPNEDFVKGHTWPIHAVSMVMKCIATIYRCCSNFSFSSTGWTRYHV